MPNSEFEYCRRRAEQETTLARAAHNEVAASAHDQLAAAYAQRLEILAANRQPASASDESSRR